MSLLWKMKPRRLQSETISSIEVAGIPGVAQKKDCGIYPIWPAKLTHVLYKRDTATNKVRGSAALSIWSNDRARKRPVTMRRRDDRDSKTYFRSERVFATNGQWYFSTREGNCGPFRTSDLARAALARFINEKVELDGFQKSREREVTKPKVSLAERLKIADVARRTPDVPELLI